MHINFFSLKAPFIEKIFSYCSTDNESPYVTWRAVSKKGKEIVDGLLEKKWSELKGNLPSQDLNSKYITIGTRTELTHLQKFITLTNEVESPSDILFTPHEYQRVKNDEALKALWIPLRITFIYYSPKNLPTNRASAQAIRKFLLNNKEKVDDIKELCFKDCHLESIPKEILLFKNLEVLDLSSNAIESIPKWISELKKVKSLDLSKNRIKTLPLEFIEQTQLLSLNLSHNLLRSLPKEFEKFKSLQSLCLTANYFEKIPLALTQMNHLEKVFFFENPLKSVPKNLKGQTFHLFRLSRDLGSYIPRKSFFESKFEAYSPLALLYQAILKNQTKESLPVALLEPNDLHLLHEMIWECSGFPQGDPLWGKNNLVKVEQFIFDLAVKRTIEEKYKRLESNDKNQITALDSNHRNKRHEEFAPLSNLSALADALDQKTVNLLKFWKIVENAFPLKLKHPPQTSKEIEEWFLDDEIQHCLSKINFLNLSELGLTKLPDQFCYFTGLTHLSLSNNCLTEFPKSLTWLKDLTDLNLTNNWITEIPSSIENLKSLKNLKFLENPLKIVAEEVGNLSNLQQLFLESNGTDFPQSLFNLIELTKLGLFGNLKKIPAEIKNFQKLKQLKIRAETLESIAPEICQLPYLQTVFIRLSPSAEAIPKITVDTVSSSIVKNCIAPLSKFFDFLKIGEESTVLDPPVKEDNIYLIDPIFEENFFSISSSLGQLVKKPVKNNVLYLSKEDHELLSETILKHVPCINKYDWKKNQFSLVKMNVFTAAVEETVREKYFRLSEERKKQILGLYPSEHIFLHLPLLADAISLSEEEFLKGTCFNTLDLENEFKPLLNKYGRLSILGITRLFSTTQKIQQVLSENAQTKLEFLESQSQKWHTFLGYPILEKIDDLGNPVFTWSPSTCDLFPSENHTFYYNKEISLPSWQIRNQFETQHAMEVAFTFFKKTIPHEYGRNGCYYRNSWIQRILLDYFGIKTTSIRIENPNHKIYKWTFHIASRVGYKTTEGKDEAVIFDLLYPTPPKEEDWRKELTKLDVSEIEEKEIEETINHDKNYRIIKKIRNFALMGFKNKYK